MAQVIEVPFPIMGMNLSRSYTEQPPQTTPHAKNVRAVGAKEGRHRGGARPGLVKRWPSGTGNLIQMMAVAERTEPDSVGAERTMFLASGGSVYASVDGDLRAISGILLTEDNEPLLTEDDEEIGGGIGVHPSNMLQGSDAGGFMYIADWGSFELTGIGGVAGNILTDASVPDFGLAGVVQDDMVVTLFPVSASNVEVGTYRIIKVDVDKIELDGAITDGACNYIIGRGVKVAQAGVESLEPLITTAGALELNAPSLCVYRDRLVLVRDRVWHMSRQGDFTDWDYSGDVGDAGRAVAGTLAEAGQVGSYVVQMVPYGDDTLLFFGYNEVWVLRGDPAYGGQIDSVSRATGIVGRFAWCFTPEGGLVFLAKNGMWAMSPDGRGLTPFSRDKLPYELLNVNSRDHDVSLAYGVVDRGVHIFITPINGDTGQHWWVDEETGGFWLEEFAYDDHQPTLAMRFFAGRSDFMRVAIGSRDGFVRVFSEEASDDDGEAAEDQYELVIGPVRLTGNMDIEAIITELSSTLDGEGDVDVEIYTGRYAEEAVSNAVGQVDRRFSVTVSPGRTFSIRPRVRAPWACLRIVSDAKWEFEQMHIHAAAAGKQRLG